MNCKKLIQIDKNQINGLKRKIVKTLHTSSSFNQKIYNSNSIHSRDNEKDKSRNQNSSGKFVSNFKSTHNLSTKHEHNINLQKNGSALKTVSINLPDYSNYNSNYFQFSAPHTSKNTSEKYRKNSNMTVF